MTSFQRLSSPRDIRAVFSAGAAAGSQALTVHARRRGDDGPSRATVVVGRRVGHAVDRNRVKRRLRAALGCVPAPRSLDVVVVGRSAARGAGFGELVGELERLLARVARAAEPRRDGHDLHGSQERIAR